MNLESFINHEVALVPDGIRVKTKSGISKVYFTESPNEFPTWISLGNLSKPKVVDLVDAFPIEAMSFILSARDEEICEARERNCLISDLYRCG